MASYVYDHVASQLSYDRYRDDLGTELQRRGDWCRNSHETGERCFERDARDLSGWCDPCIALAAAEAIGRYG